MSFEVALAVLIAMVILITAVVVRVSIQAIRAPTPAAKKRANTWIGIATALSVLGLVFAFVFFPPAA